MASPALRLKRLLCFLKTRHQNTSKKWDGLHLALAMAYQHVQNTLQKMIWIALSSCYVLSTSAIRIVKRNIFCILLLMASRWVQDGFNIGFGCCTWLIDRCKIHRKKWYGFDIALDGFKMGSRWVQDGFKMGSRWLLDDQSGTATIEADDKNFIVRPLMANLVQSSQYCCSHCRASAYSALDCLPR